MKGLFVCGLLVHLLLLWAPFDIYFVSPIIHGMTPVKSSVKPPAKRVVLIVADGLRAEAMYFKGNHIKVPFLTDIRRRRGSWGISHTRVPTESRPGHVALLAGIYEDPSAIMKGWKANPVTFDTAINQSKNAWCWGSPDIVNLFNINNSPHIHVEAYDATMQDFGKANTTVLDDWVMKKVTQIINNNSKINCKDLCEEGNLFFLHLLGTDTAGHAYKPFSKEYIENIRFVDNIARKTEILFENFFNDNSTAYIFTADHGMTNWGSHGAGTNHETETPFIAWGSGIKASNTRRDIEQANIAPLLSALIGRNLPVNSVGIIPHHYLNVSKHNLAEIMLTNAKQILELYNTKRMIYKKNMFSILHKSYQLSDNSIKLFINNINNDIITGEFSLAITQCINMMQMALDGVNYYHNYFQKILLMCLSVGLIGWIVYLIINIRGKHNKKNNIENLLHKNTILHLSVCIILSITFVYVQSLPFMFSIYFAFPFVMLIFVYQDVDKLQHTIEIIKEYGYFNALFRFVIYVSGCLLLVQGFFQRQFLSVLLFGIGIWAFRVRYRYFRRKQKCIWFALNAVMTVFTSLPVMHTEFNLFFFGLGIATWIFVFSNIYINTNCSFIWFMPSTSRIINFQMLIFIISCLNTVSVAISFYIGSGLTWFNQIISWIVMVLAFLSPLLTELHIFTKLFGIILGLISFYVLVTVNYELLFMLNLSLLMYQWIQIENILVPQNIIPAWKNEFNKPIGNKNEDLEKDVRQSFFFLTYIMIGFFGTGNIASLNSFDPMWVRCFITVFSPFTMTVLIFIKILIPFIIVTCSFRGVRIICKSSKTYSLNVILIMTDFMLFNFLYFVKNEGSWLEIGMSLSHYIIFELISIILLILYAVAYVLTTYGSCVRNIIEKSFCKN